MLKSYITGIPSTKFVLITDSHDYRDERLFEYLVHQHLNHRDQLHYCVFEGVFSRARAKWGSSNAILHDFVSSALTDQKLCEKFEHLVANLHNNDVIVIDSLANVIFLYGLSFTYRLFNSMANNKALKQIIAVLHQDLIPESCDNVRSYFGKLSTLSIFNINPRGSRLSYDYKKVGGKVISETEKFHFEGDNLITIKEVKPSPTELIERATSAVINPEELASFRIGLSDEEKLLKDKVILPYLPNESEAEGQGKISYQFDEADDWDEEDPDDDLDI